MSRYLIVCITVFILNGCSSQPTTTEETSSNIQRSTPTQVALSHAKAYLLIGNIQQAQKSFDDIDNLQTTPNAMLLRAELKAAAGDTLGAQQDFLFAINNEQFSGNEFPNNLLEYFCKNEKWVALEAYGAKIGKQGTQTKAQNAQLTSIGLCFFSNREWDKTALWLAKLDFNEPAEPMVYLALARANIEHRKLVSAQNHIDLYEKNKIQISADTLSVAIEVYQALDKPDKVKPLASNLRLLFPTWNTAQNEQLINKTERAQPKLSLINSSSKPIDDTVNVSRTHIIQRGETLYKLSKSYDISIDNLLKWNPNLVIDDIALGTPIRLSTGE